MVLTVLVVEPVLRAVVVAVVTAGLAIIFWGGEKKNPAVKSSKSNKSLSLA